MPHTVEEAYEVADAAHGRRRRESSSTSSATCSSRRTSWRCCSRSAGQATWTTVARNVHDKLVRRHPHVFGDAESPERRARCASAGSSSRPTQEGREGVFHDVPETLPALLHARKVQRRAAAIGFDVARPRRAASRSSRRSSPSCATRCAAPASRSRRPSPTSASSTSSATCSSRAVNVARRLNVDPELALRGTTARFVRAGRACRRSWRPRAATSGRRSGSTSRTRYYERGEGGSWRERDRACTGAADPRLARQPDRRGRRRARVRRVRPRGRAVRAPRPASTRRSSCATATRPSTAARACRGRSRTSTARSRPRVRGLDAADQAALDRRLLELDGTPNKGRLGANAILGVSLAVAKAAAADAGVSLFRWLGRGSATRRPAGADDERRSTAARTRENSIDLQEFMVVPAGAESFAEALRIGAEVYHALKALLHERGLATAVGDEGGFAPDLASSEEAIEAILEAAERAGHARPGRDRARPGDDRVLPRRRLPRRGPRARRRGDGSLYWSELAERYPDRVDRGRAGRGRLGRLARSSREQHGDRLQLVGDDLFVTNVERLRRGIDEGVGNAILVKVNQIGTLTETLEAIELARASRLRDRDLAPLGRDGGHDDRRPRRRDERRPDQDRAHRRGRTASRSTTSCCASRRSSATRAVYPGWGVFPRAAGSGREPWPRTDAVGSDEDRRHDRAGDGRQGDDRAARRRRHRRGPPQLLARHAGRPARGVRGPCASVQSGKRPAARADRRPAGAEAARRRPRGAACVVESRRRARRRRRGLGTRRRPRPSRPRSSATCSRRARRADRRRPRAPARRARRATGVRAAPSSSAARSGRTRASTCRACLADPVAHARRTSSDLEFALELGVDYVALSFVRSRRRRRATSAAARRSAARTARVIAKIEKAEAVDALDDIVAETPTR